MSGRLQRFSALAGLGAVVLWGVGIVILEAVAGAFPEGASPEEARGYFQENENAVVAGSFIFMLAGRCSSGSRASSAARFCAPRGARAPSRPSRSSAASRPRSLRREFQVASSLPG